jgi:hypothetical protein
MLANCRIYRVVDTRTNETVYIGSTKQSLSQRMTKHRSGARKGRPGAMATLIRENGADCYKIVLVYEYENITRDQLRKHEQESIEEHAGLKNARRAYLSDEGRIAMHRAACKVWNDANQNKHRCDACNFSSSHAADLAIHLKSLKHHEKVGTVLAEFVYECAPCGIATNNKSNYTRHCKSKKHARNTA